MSTAARILMAARQGQTLFEGYVYKAPATTADYLEAATSVPGLAGTVLGPMPWPQDGTNLPQVGDKLCIARLEGGRFWAIGWFHG